MMNKDVYNRIIACVTHILQSCWRTADKSGWWVLCVRCQCKGLYGLNRPDDRAVRACDVRMTVEMNDIIRQRPTSQNRAHWRYLM